MKTKPVAWKSRTKAKLKAKPLTEIRSTISKNKSKTEISKRPQKPKT